MNKNSGNRLCDDLHHMSEIINYIKDVSQFQE